MAPVPAPAVYGAVFGVFPAVVSGAPSRWATHQTRDFVYADVAEAFLRPAEPKHVNEIYNLGAGKPQPINRLVPGATWCTCPNAPGSRTVPGPRVQDQDPHGLGTQGILR